jgi:hypothetical protein
MLVASVLMLTQLLHRHTTGMARFSKWEWSVNRGFRKGRLGSILIAGLDEVQDQSLRAIEHYRSRDGLVRIVRLQSISRNDTVRIWHILVQTLDKYSTPIALRPVNAEASLIDLMKLQLFPKLSSSVRFAVFGLRAIETRELANGPARALIPPDIGLIRNADQLILDFTARPFDTVEFSRMLAVADQLKKIV